MAPEGGESGGRVDVSIRRKTKHGEERRAGEHVGKERGRDGEGKGGKEAGKEGRRDERRGED
ncbi:hypothetical protein A0H81_13304 [Grifola frondosa]|uniref:Uncharacterized protein n=1 Tax=Grifola frondosa TaxID=5627 RepID=A0A1C7LQN9_GRIFR|nr:hypothetical protein A0H81_13304 [Grifola frondosa]